MFHIGSPVRLTARDGGLLAIRGCPSLRGEGLISSLSDPPVGVLLLRTLSDDPPCGTRDAALAKGELPSWLIAVGLGATGGPAYGILLCGLVCSPVGFCPADGVFPEFTFGFWSIGELLLEYIVCYSIRGWYIYTGDFKLSGVTSVLFCMCYSKMLLLVIDF